MSIGPFKARSNSEQNTHIQMRASRTTKAKEEEKKKTPIWQERERAYLLEQMKNNDLYKVKFSHLLD